MATDATAFLRKRKDKRRALGSFPRGPNDPPRRITSSAASPSVNHHQTTSASSPSTSAPTPTPTSSSPALGPNVVEIKLWSGSSSDGLRWNMAKFNSIREFDPASSLDSPLLTRKLPGERIPPSFAADSTGKIIGKYLYSPDGTPTLGPDGTHAVELFPPGIDLSLVGGSENQGAAGGGKRKKGVKEVYSQDKEVMRLRREEATPWVMESGRQIESEGQGNHVQWVGRMQEATTLPSVLLVSDGSADGFKVIPLGRTYRFEPDRPFQVNDPDAANREYEYQSKHRIYNRWGNNGHMNGANGAHPDASKAENGLAMPSGSGSGDIKPKIENLSSSHAFLERQEEKALRWERQLQPPTGNQSGGFGGVSSRPKQERWEDDDRREGRKLTRGMEGGVDEELDFDINEEFQDDEDVNTFYRDPEEEEEAKLQEERQKKEYRMANANVGDKPQIEENLSDEDDLFGENALTADGKRLKRIMKKRKRGEDDDLFGDDSDDDSDDSEESEKEKEEEKEKEKEETPKKSAEDTSSRSRGASPRAPNSAERPNSRPPSRAHNRSGTSPIPRRPGPTGAKAATAPPPGSGHSLAAQRATSRAASPLARSRGNSPSSGRGVSPEVGGSGDRRSPGPGSRGMSPSSRLSPPPPTAHSREISPVPNTSNRQRSTTPQNSNTNPTSVSGSGNKRKPSPSPIPGSSSGGGGGGEVSRKKKKSSSTTPSGTPAPEDQPPFPGMITRSDVVDWFKSQPPTAILMKDVISAFKNKIAGTKKKEDQEKNQKLFTSIIKTVTDRSEGKLRLKDEYR